MTSSPCNYMDLRGEDHEKQTTTAYGCLIEGQSPWVRVWTAQPIGFTPALSVIQKRRCSCRMLPVTLYKCYMPVACFCVYDSCNCKTTLNVSRPLRCMKCLKISVLLSADLRIAADLSPRNTYPFTSPAQWQPVISKRTWAGRSAHWHFQRLRFLDLSEQAKS